MIENAIPCESNNVPQSVKISILEHEVELTFADTEDTNLFDRLQQTLFQSYIQTVAYPH